MLFNSIGCFVQSPPFALPHFNNIEAFLVSMVSSQCIELSLLATTLNVLFSGRGKYFLTGTEVVKATHGFKHSVAVRTKPIDTKAIFFCLPVVKKLSILHSGLVRWRRDMTIFSKLRVLFRRGVTVHADLANHLKESFKTDGMILRSQNNSTWINK